MSASPAQGFDGAVAVVTGGSMGIGLGAVQALAAAGARVVVGSRTIGDDLHAVLSDNVHAVAGDLAARGGPERLIEEAQRLHGGVDVLVNNVGGMLGGPRFRGFLEIDDDMWSAIVDFNLFSAIRACRAAIPSMIARGAGAIVNVSSYNGLQPEKEVLDYSAIKAALNSLTRSLSHEFGPAGIRVNTVSPGATWSESWKGEGRWADLIAAETDQTREEVVSTTPDNMKIPLRRFGAVNEVVEAIMFLASPAASYITGANLLVDGGVTKGV
jgi:NAD(P)-dependent dehydrogenase (short-subunit alcohol dehydrogenase family)